MESAEWTPALQNLVQALEQTQSGLETVVELAPDLQRLFERARELGQKAALFSNAPDPEGVRWAEVSAQLRLVESPLDIAQAFSALTKSVQAPLALDDEDPSNPESIQALMAGDPGRDGAPQALGAAGGVGQRAWVFTSATLGDEPTLRWFTEPCGLTSAQVMQVTSPFDYARQAALYVPEHLPKPGDPGHATQVAQLVAEAVQLLGGRTLVLTTTLRALRAIGDALQARFQGAGELEVLVQGQWPKSRLIDRFRQGAAQGSRGCVLVASASFWEGVDVKGPALRLVISSTTKPSRSCRRATTPPPNAASGPSCSAIRRTSSRATRNTGWVRPIMPGATTTMR